MQTEKEIEKEMPTLEKVKELYSSYLNADRTLSHNESYKKKGGLFGSLIRGIKDTTLEEEFTKALKKELQEYQKELQEDSNNLPYQKTSALTQLPSLLSFIYTAQDEMIRDERSYYMLISLHSLTKDLIPYLSAEEAKQLRTEYPAEKKKEFAALPACQEILKLLEKQAKGGISS